MRKALIITLSLIIVIFGLVGCSNKDNEQDANNNSQGEYSVADTQKVQEALKDDSWIVVDTRLNDAFNGWKLDGISRGGRITGAVDFSANWLKVEDDNKEELLNEALETKGITEDKNIVLYDTNGKDSKEVADYLKGKGFNNLYLYDVNKWADDESLPMEKYENYQLVVPATIVKDVIDGKKPETFENAKNIKIVEGSWGEEKTSYANGHIPTAFHINTDEIEPPTTEAPMMWMLADDETLKEVALKYGFTKDDTVIVTGEEPMASYRVATVLRYIGVNDVRVLNGGTMAWTMAGYELETTSNKATPVEDFGGVIPGNPDVIDTMEETRAGLKTPDKFTLVDNRTWDEHIGKSSGYSYHDKMGRVPGSVFGYAGKTDSYSLDYYRNIDKTMRNANEFIALWKEQGIDTNKHLSFMCGSGWRVAEIYTYADVVGLDDISIFSDGWIGWSNDPSNPIETGEPKKVGEKLLKNKILDIIAYGIELVLFIALFILEYLSGYKGGVMKHLYFKKMEYLGKVYTQDAMMMHSIVIVVLFIGLLVICKNRSSFNRKISIIMFAVYSIALIAAFNIPYIKELNTYAYILMVLETSIVIQTVKVIINK